MDAPTATSSLQPSPLQLTPAGLVGVVLCWTMPCAALLAMMAASQWPKYNSVSVAAKNAVTGKGDEVPKDIIRRQTARASQKPTSTDRLLQFATWFCFVAPLMWAFASQEDPTAAEQLTMWWDISWTQLTDGKLNLNFQIACSLLLIERLTYTWVGLPCPGTRIPPATVKPLRILAWCRSTRSPTAT